MTTLFYNGKIYSMDESDNVYSAMVVCGGKLVDFGESDALIAKYPDVDLYNLDGKSVIPGLIDTHAHIFMAADSEGDGELFIPESVAELLDDLKEKVKVTPKGQWISYKNTYPLRLDELRYPTLAELDEIAPDNPVAVDGFYSAQLNTCALNSLDLTTLPQGGRVMTDKDGERTGVLLNCYAILGKHYSTRKIKPYKEAISEVMTEYNKNGITTTVEAMSNLAGIEAVEELQKEKRQSVRVRYTMMVPPKEKHDEFRKTLKDVKCANPDFARISFLKNTIDGGILTGTSLMDGEYKGLSETFGLDGIESSWRGNLVTDIPILCDSIKLAQELGLQYGAHCVGTQASRKLLAAYKQVGNTEGQRHTLLHADFMAGDMIEASKEMDITILFQPAWHYMDAPHLSKILTARECKYFMPYADMLSFGAHVAAGSDHMVKYDPLKSVNPYHPFVALHNMVTCTARDGKVYGEDQKISRRDALLTYTRHAAWSLFDEDLIGSLKRGNRADFLILDRDYFCCEEREIPEIKPVKTYIDGECVYSA